MKNYCGKLKDYNPQIAENKERLEKLEEVKEYQEAMAKMEEIDEKINIGLAFEEYYAGKVNPPVPNMSQIQEILEMKKEAIEARRKEHEENAQKRRDEMHAEKVEKAKVLSQENQELGYQISELEKMRKKERIGRHATMRVRGDE